MARCKKKRSKTADLDDKKKEKKEKNNKNRKHRNLIRKTNFPVLIISAGVRNIPLLSCTIHECDINLFSKNSLLITKKNIKK